MNVKETKVFNSILRAWKMRNEGTFTWNDFDLLVEAFKAKLTAIEWKRIQYNLDRVL
jgi:predicted nucleotidyltransferase